MKEQLDEKDPPAGMTRVKSEAAGTAGSA